jgi:dUTP pyrophosphatase
MIFPRSSQEGLKMKLRYRKLDPSARIEGPRHEGDAGVDLFSSEEVVVEPGESRWVGTGIAVEIPRGYVGIVKERSGLAHRFGTGAGVVDSSYRGEVRVLVRNLGREPLRIGKGEPLAQLLLLPCAEVELEEGELSPTERGERGFGSTRSTGGGPLSA